jgi:uncharacterized protein YxeA
MKKVIFLCLALVLCCASLVHAAPKSLTFAWEQAGSITDLAGWKLYEVTGTPKVYTLFVTIPYVSQQATYTSAQTIEFPNGAVTTKTYVLTAYDKSGNESAKSNEASATVDFEAPNVPTVFTITVNVVTP